MSLYNFIVEKFIMPISDVAFKRELFKDFTFLMKSQWWSEDQLIDYQNQKLKDLIMHAYSNVPYYTDLFDKLKLKPSDIGSRDDLYKIPFLTKDDIRKNYPKLLVARNINQIPHYRGNSSGSTGTPIEYLVSKRSYSFNIATNLRGWYWMGYRLGDKFVKLSVNARTKEKKLQDIFLRTNYINYKFTDTDYKKLTEEIISFGPKVLRSYPDPLFFYALFLEKNNIDISVPLLTTTGNMLLPVFRNKIESIFKTKIFDSYRCEGGPNAFENPTHETYISSMEYGIAEILSNGKEVGPGEKGSFITTDLHNYAMPFIRYDSKDVVIKGKQKCSSGRNHLTIDKILGRNSDILITPRNGYFIVHNFSGYFAHFDSIDQFQIKQEKIDLFEFNLKVNSNYNLDIESKIISDWLLKLGDDVTIKIKLVISIPINENGKRRFLIRNDNIKLAF